MMLAGSDAGWLRCDRVKVATVDLHEREKERERRERFFACDIFQRTLVCPNIINGSANQWHISGINCIFFLYFSKYA